MPRVLWYQRAAETGGAAIAHQLAGMSNPFVAGVKQKIVWTLINIIVPLLIAAGISVPGTITHTVAGGGL